jgi:Autotransporter beta-domain
MNRSVRHPWAPGRTRQRQCFAAALAVVCALLLWPHSQARAQFVCVVNGIDQSCTNSGTAGSFNLVPAANGNGSATNTGTGVDVGVQTSGSGSATTTNSGTARDLNAQALGSGNATTTNSGTSRDINTQALGGGNATLTNSGTSRDINTQALGGGNATLTNLGTIGGDINLQAFGGGNATLTNIIGSRVIGAINVGGTNATVNFVGGNWLFTFNSLAGTTINAGGAPFVVVGNRVAVLDPTAFALADRALMNFTGGISAMLQGRFNGMPTGPGGTTATSFAPTTPSVIDDEHAAFAGIPSLAMAYASDPTRNMFGKAPAAVPYYDTVIWANGFGGQRRQEADGLILKATDTAFGGAIGVDRLFTPGVRLGAFIGGGAGRVKVDFDTQVTDTTYVFGGGYGRIDWVSRFLDFALYVGSANNKSTRGIANNLVPGGFEFATASYNGWFISPDVTYGVRIPVMDLVVTPRARVRYVAGILDGYTETGSAQNLTVGTRNLQDVEERLEVELSKVAPAVWGGTIKTTANVGAIGLQRLGDTNINTVLLGQNLAFVTPGRSKCGRRRGRRRPRLSAGRKRGHLRRGRRHPDE